MQHLFALRPSLSVIWQALEGHQALQTRWVWKDWAQQRERVLGVQVSLGGELVSVEEFCAAGGERAAAGVPPQPLRRHLQR